MLVGWSVFLCYFPVCVSYLCFHRHFLFVFLLSSFIPLQSKFYPVAGVLFLTGTSAHGITHCKILWFFPSAHKIISRLLSLEYQALYNFVSVYFSISSLPFSKIITKSCQSIHNSPNTNFPAYLHTFGHAVPSARTMQTFFVYLINSRLSFETQFPSHFPLGIVEYPFFRASNNSQTFFQPLMYVRYMSLLSVFHYLWYN